MADKQILIRLDVELLDRLRYLHEKEGPINEKTKKRRPFNVYLRSILGDYVFERMREIKKLNAPMVFSKDEEEDFE